VTGQDGKYFKLCNEISVKSFSELSSEENRIHKQENETENIANSEAKLFIKRRPSQISTNQDEHLSISPTSKPLQRDSVYTWSSEPALTLTVPQLATGQELPFQNQLRNQYDVFDESDGVILSKVIASKLGHPELTVVERKIVRSTKFKVWRALRYFFVNTSFHGLPHIAASKSCIRICFWAFLILISLALMLLAIIMVSIKYISFDTYIKRELEEPNRLKFPAVTICNLNQYTKSYFQKNLGYSEEDLFNVTLFVDALSSRRRLTKNHDISELNILINELAEQYDDDIAEISFGDTESLDFSHRLENMLVSCYFDNQPCFGQHFTPKVNIKGRCFTFNSNTSDVLYASSPGALYGLELILNVEQHEYFMPHISSVGFEVYVHQQGDFPYLGEHSAFTVSPGVHTNVVLSTERLEYLEPPYGACEKDLKLEYFSVYTREACLDECRTKATIRVCGCRLFYMPGSATVCSPSEYVNCVVDLLRNFWDLHQCDCPLPCNIPESYRFELSYSAYPAKHVPLLLHKAGVLPNVSGLPESIHNPNATDDKATQEELLKFFKENFVKITLYYNQLSLNKLTEVLEYDTFQFIADFGGHLGLFTGAGFLTFFEFVEVCLGVFYPTTLDNDL